jgi:predicted permease
VASEIAVALTLSTSATLCGLALVRLLGVNPGFERDRALTMRVSANATRYPTQEATVLFFNSLATQVGALPGVDGAAVAFTLPLSNQPTGTDVMSAEHPLPPAQRLNVGWQMASPGYFHAVGIPIVRGRDFRVEDHLRPRHSTIISESVAQTLFGDADPIGRLVSVGGGEAEGDWHEVLGVAGDVRHTALAEPPTPRVYDAFGPHWERTMFLVIRAQSGVEPAALTPIVRSTIAAVDPTVPVFEIATMGDLVDRSVAGPRFAALLAAGLAGISILLALVGTFAVVACSVAERQRELGVRVALGATTRGIFALILGDTLMTALMGCVVGGVGAALAARILAGQLFGVRPADAAAFIAVLAVALTVASVAAAWWPARRGASVDPLVAIRE